MGKKWDKTLAFCDGNTTHSSEILLIFKHEKANPT